MSYSITSALTSCQKATRVPSGGTWAAQSWAKADESNWSLSRISTRGRASVTCC
eukprot:CAMPEP_0202108226 /NCGR_PEP_ID=MMETSP0965-20130614/19932_1 /ASSEMBLY_ACC=CAM_ASM_000507 /TAXON_ID=4773 /ORGANISM="Schizochytrium aggregatum, Strain ATCC28209" /LENGTH=53 /DNA_ID=CAMNT_0048677461 /DNA_START=45 /DNA_END=203 /DNA_ORIENTATION=+